MKLVCVPNFGKENSIEILKQIHSICKELKIGFLLSNHYEAAVPGIYEAIGMEKKHILPKEEAFKEADIALSLGGDGTIIQLAKEVLDFHLPVCGIHLGELGFLNQIDVSSLKEKLQSLIAGDYIVENRALLQSYIAGKEGKRALPLALNDLIVTRTEPGKMARIILTINGEEAQQYPADGFIIATATGSTGYNLSAGGPILSPENHSIIVTPICPHLLQKAPLVLSKEAQISLTMPLREKSLFISVDGTFETSFTNEETVVIETYHACAKFIRFKEQGFFNTLFKKLNTRCDVLG